MKIAIVAGARPNFMKIAPIMHALKERQKLSDTIDCQLIHTGQHYDARLSDYFFEDLNIPYPDINFSVGSGSHAKQTAEIMVKFEAYLETYLPDWVVVVGDVNSTVACALVATKMHIKVAHVEAGLRSGDKTMPEEINRLATDAISDLLFTTTPEASRTLLAEGHSADKVSMVGNTMIDSLKYILPSCAAPHFYETSLLEDAPYLVLTLHRPSNVDDIHNLTTLIETIASAAIPYKIVFPIHPRTQHKLSGIALPDNVLAVEPIRYKEFIYVLQRARGILTDSGGIQEEASYLQVPCITLRNNTERPETIVRGTNELIGTNKQAIIEAIQRIIAGQWKKGDIAELWDGHAANRICDKLLENH